MKTYPVKWNTAQLAFFCGLLSRHIGILELKQIVDGIYPNGSPSIYFVSVAAELDRLIPADQWDGVVAVCERMFK